MQITIPQEINSSTLISTNVPDGDYPTWVAGTYNRGDRVVEGIKIYEVVAQTTTEQPTVGINSDPPTWVDVGYINRWKMFTNTKDTKTIQSESIDVTFISGDDIYDKIALLGCVGTSATVQVIVDSVIEFEQEIPLVDIGVSDMWEFFYLPYYQIEDIALELPYYQGAQARVLIENPGADAACGRIVIGFTDVLGSGDYGAVYGTSVGFMTFSAMQRNDFGDLTLKQGRNVSTANYEVVIETDFVSDALKIIRKTSGKICLFIGDEEKEATILLGVPRGEPVITYNNPSSSNLSLEVEGA